MCLDTFVSDYGGLLRAGNHSLTGKVHKFICGLIQAERRNIERMTEHVPDMDYQSHHHLISVSPWKDRPVRDKIASDADRLLKNGPNRCIIFDETAFTKKGKESIGVARQWSGQLGKVDSCQVAVFALLADKKDGCLIDGRLFLPEGWSEDAKRCEKAGLPEELRVNKSKVVIALEMLDHLDGQGVGYEWVLADAGYGKDPKFLHSLGAAGKKFVVDVHKSQSVYEAHPFENQKPQGEGHQKLRCLPKSVEVKDLVAGLDKSDWKWVTTEIGSKGPKRIRAYSQRVWILDKATNQAWEWDLVVRRKGEGGPDSEIKYSLSNASGNTPLRTLVWAQGHRYKVEQGFQEGKQELGMDDYQVRVWQGWQHHITLTMLAGLFLMEMKRIYRQMYQHISLRDMWELLKPLLPTLKNSQVEILKQIERRHKQRERDLNRKRPE